MPLQQPTPTSSPKATVSVAKICSVIMVFLAMLTAATLPLQVSWLWLLLPLIFLAYIDLSSSGPSLFAALVTPQTWLFYGGLVALAVAFQFGGLRQAKPVSRPVIAANSISQPTPSAYPKMSSNQRPNGPSWSNAPSVAPGSSLPRPVSPPMSIRQTTVPSSAPSKTPVPMPMPSQVPIQSPQTSPTPVVTPTVSARPPAPPQPVVVAPGVTSSSIPPEPTPATVTPPAPTSARLPASTPGSAPASPSKKKGS